MMIWKQHIFESGNSVVAPLTKQRAVPSPSLPSDQQLHSTPDRSLPPQVASIGLTPAVMKLTCRPLVAGRGGKKQPLMGGYVHLC